GSVAERRAEAAGLDHAARGPVDLCAEYPGPRGGNSRGASSIDERVHLALAIARRAEHEGARDVGAVALDARPDIDEQDVALLEPPLPGMAVRASRVLADQHDRI